MSKNIIWKNLVIGLALFLILASAVSAQKAQSSPSAQIDVDDNGVPIIVKHLPDWETAQKRAKTVANLRDLQNLLGNRQIINDAEFAGGTEAVVADYDNAKLAIIEFPTPQMAVDADAKFAARIGESPNTIYRKIGNYSVFVFDAPDDTVANSLLDRVNYEKSVEWLGDNPFPYIQAKRKEREYLSTTGDILVTVIKTSGLAIVAALGFGGLCGGLLFYLRRRQQLNADAYTDAGGMMRLNLDELSAQTNHERLLEK